MKETVIRHAESEWSKQKPTRKVVEAYAEIKDVPVDELPCEIYNLADVQAIDKLFESNKCEFIELSFQEEDVTISITKQRVKVTANPATGPS